jgi:hypothetical protein
MRRQTQAPAQLAFDSEHFVRTGTFRICVDDRLVVEEDIEGQVSKGVIGIKIRKGRVEDILKVSPGKREVRVRVTWEDNSREESVKPWRVGWRSAGILGSSVRPLPHRLQCGRFREHCQGIPSR